MSRTLSSAPIHRIYEIIADVSKYPLFLPYCLASRILSVNKENNMLAALDIGFAGFSHSYTSNVFFIPQKSITMIMADDHSTRLLFYRRQGTSCMIPGEWRLSRAPMGTRLEFYLDFEFRNKLYDGVASLALERVCGEIKCTASGGSRSR